MPRRKQKNMWPFGSPSKRVTRSKAELAQIAAEQREAERGYLSSEGWSKSRRKSSRKAHGTRLPAKKGLPRKTEAFWRGAGVEFDPSLFRENGMPKNPAKFDRCVKAVKAKGGAYDPYAVCTAAGTRNPSRKPYKATKDWEFWLKDGEVYRNARGNRGPISDTGMPANVRWESSKAHFDHYFGKGIYNPSRSRRRNPPEQAAEAYRDFHGRPSEETVVVKREIHYHKHLAALGELKKLVVVSREGYKVPIDRFKGATLCENEKGTQLYVEGGDQSVGLDQFGIDPDEAHEMEVLGDVVQVLYFTRKDHLGKEGGIANYDHKFKEPYPELQYDVRNEQLIFSGGKYVILPEGIDR